VLETKDDGSKIQLLTTMKIALISLLSMTYWPGIRWVKTEDRACLKQTTINNVLQISLNGKGTVLFDPSIAYRRGDGCETH
jgi:hypothetical protein